MARIIIIEDEQSIRNVLKNILKDKERINGIILQESR